MRFFSNYCTSKRLWIVLLLLVLLWFAPARPAWAAAFTSKATGNWSASGQTTWNEVGVPGDGDSVTIAGAHTITIDQDIGTNGNGIKQIVLNHASAKLQFSNTGSAYTLYFASTGTDPLGGGTNTNPTFASATMFGLFVARGSLMLDGNSTHVHTITSGDNTNPIYIHHNWGDFGNFTGANLSLTYINVKHLGTAVGGMQGIFWRGESGFTFVVDHSRFDDPYSVVYNAAGLAPTFTFNYISNARSHTLDFTNGVVRAPGLTITDNTEVTPAVSGKAFLYALSGSGASGVGITFQRNALLANATTKKLIHTQAGSLNGSGGHHSITDNVAVSTGSDGIGINTLMTDTELNVYRNILDGYYQGVTLSGQAGNIHENVVLAESGSFAGQGQIITYGYASGLAIHHNVFKFTSLGTDHIALFLFKSGGSGDSGTVHHNTIYTAASGAATTRAILIGESGFYNTNSIVRDNLVTGAWAQGIADGNGAGSTNTYISDYAGTGVHHNAVQGPTTGWKNNGGTNFTDGTNAHPNVVYGDVTTAATFVDTTRTLLTFDTSLGGAGTYANLFSKLADRCDCTGTAWNSAYNIDQTGGLWDYLMSGWKPTNAAFQAGSDNVSPSNGWIGAVQGVDTTSPTVSVTAPADNATVSGSSVTLSATASDNIAVAGVQFKLDTNTNIGSEDTTSTYGVTWDSTAVADGSHTIIAVARDTSSNYATSSAVTVTIDNTPPVLSAGTPSGEQAANSASISLSLSTDENAFCKYGTTANTTYASIANSFSATSTVHSATISGLSNGQSYAYYIRCQDGAGNTNTSDYPISFSIATAAQQTSSGGGGGFSAPDPTAPVGGFTATSSVINSQNKTTLHFGFGNDITNVAISDNVNFAPATYINATSSIEWTATTIKILHIKYCNKYGKCSNPISVQINAPAPAPIIFNSYKFYQNLAYRMTGADVLELQKYLNAQGFVLAQSGFGSFGKETNYFGLLTYKALIKFQESHFIDILTPIGLAKGTGYFGPRTRAFVNK